MEIDKLVVDEELVKKMQRWMLGIAAGGCILLLTVHKLWSDHLPSVAFDLEDGPVIDGIYPPLMLSPAERENMSVCV